MKSNYRNERFSEETYRAYEFARDEAKRLKHAYMDTEHLLLGLLALKESRAAKILVNLGTDLDKLRDRILMTTGAGCDLYLPSAMPLWAMIRIIVAHKISQHRRTLPATGSFLRVLELSGKEADTLNSKKIETEHLLLALLRDEDGETATALTVYYVDYKRAYGELQKIVRDEGEQK